MKVTLVRTYKHQCKGVIYNIINIYVYIVYIATQPLLSLLRIVLYRLMQREHIYMTRAAQGSIQKYVLISPASIKYYICTYVLNSWRD